MQKLKQPTAIDEPQLVCINVPEAKINRDPHTREELVAETQINARASRIANEFEKGFAFIKRYPRTATFYGSARFKPSNIHYQDARRLAFALSERGYAIVTGGGPGIMEAANRGAHDAGGPSIGLNIKLPAEQVINPYVTESTSFKYFFSRKTALSFSAEAYVFYPGGFGTLDEFFEIITLIQTKKIARVPVILVGSDFWQPLHAFIADMLLLRHGTINKSDLDLYRIIDDHNEVIKIIEKAPTRK